MKTICSVFSLEALPADADVAFDADAAVGDNEIEISLLIAFNIYN